MNKSFELNHDEWHSRIATDICNVGYHITLVAGTILPRFAYSIGGTSEFGSELIFAGGELYSRYDLAEIFSGFFKKLRNNVPSTNVLVDLGSLGKFKLSPVDDSWCKLLALHALNFYNQEVISAFQILPDEEHYTLDIPDLSQRFEKTNRIWRWLTEECDLPLPSKSMAITNLEVLFGRKTTEVVRWEENEWEIYAGSGPDVPIDQMRAVPMAVLIGIDKSLEPVLHLKVGEGVWRDPDDLVWNNWE